MQPTRWWVQFGVILFVILAWPPDGDRSLMAKFVNWAVDPAGELPVLPPQLPDSRCSGSEDALGS